MGPVPSITPAHGNVKGPPLNAGLALPLEEQDDGTEQQVINPLFQIMEDDMENNLMD